MRIITRRQYPLHGELRKGYRHIRVESRDRLQDQPVVLLRASSQQLIHRPRHRVAREADRLAARSSLSLDCLCEQRGGIGRRREHVQRLVE